MATSKSRTRSVSYPVSVQPGRIKVNSVWLLHNYKKVQVYMVDCASKYPEVTASSGGDGLASIYLDAGDYTQRYDAHAKSPTEIRFPTKCKHPTIEAAASRYTVHVTVFHNDNDSAPQVWSDDVR